MEVFAQRGCVVRGYPNAVPPPEDPRAATHRRALLTSVVALGAGVLAGCSAEGEAEPSAPADTSSGASTVPATGERQAGVDRPAGQQAHLGLMVLDIHPPADARDLLDRLGEQIDGLAAGSDPVLDGFDPARLTVTVGLGPRVVRRFRGAGSPGTTDLPEFAREQIPSGARGGDLLVQVCADDPTVVTLALGAVEASLDGRAELRWTVTGFRGVVEESGAPRNLLGFHDGISVPRASAELDDDVWLDEVGAEDSTIAVVRLMRLDVARFVRQPVADQERIIGRRRRTGAPLSGGDIATDPELLAKNDRGEYDIAVDAHVRRAHPLPGGAGGLMLRRGYSYARTPEDQGLVFISFQRSLRMFTQTQARLDEQDALMEYATTTASGTFWILPGFAAGRRLGANL